MRVDGGLMGDLSGVPGHAKRLENLGYHGAVTAETSHDPFFPLLLAAQETQDIELVTSIAVAFSRTPMNLANIGHDLKQFLKGTVRPGPGFPDPAAHYQAIQHALVKTSCTDARVHFGNARNLGLLAQWNATFIRRRFLHSLADDTHVYTARY